MKKRILIILYGITFQLYAQESKKMAYEQIAIDYFTDSLVPQLKNYRIITTGLISNQKSDPKYIKFLTNRFFFEVLQKNKGNDLIGNNYMLELDRVSKTLCKSKRMIPIFPTGHIGNKLKVSKPLIEKKKINYRDLKGRFFKIYGKTIYNFLFKERYILAIKSQFYFDNKHWIELRLDRPDFEYGRIYILRLDNKGMLLDFSETFWIH